MTTEEKQAIFQSRMDELVAQGWEVLASEKLSAKMRDPNGNIVQLWISASGTVAMRRKGREWSLKKKIFTFGVLPIMAFFIVVPVIVAVVGTDDSGEPEQEIPPVLVEVPIPGENCLTLGQRNYLKGTDEQLNRNTDEFLALWRILSEAHWERNLQADPKWRDRVDERIAEIKSTSEGLLSRAAPEPFASIGYEADRIATTYLATMRGIESAFWIGDFDAVGLATQELHDGLLEVGNFRLVLQDNLELPPCFAEGPSETEVTAETPEPRPTTTPSSEPVSGEDVGMVEGVLPAVVQVVTDISEGTGFVANADGLIITNRHVVGGNDQVTVRFGSGLRLQGEVTYRHPRLDIAHIRVLSPDSFLSIAIGNSDDVRLGEEVIAVGYPIGSLLGGRPTISEGIISAKRHTALQTTAAVNPGSSGGPLLNANGEVIGVITSRIEEEPSGRPIVGIGFAVPINEADIELSLAR